MILSEMRKIIPVSYQILTSSFLPGLNLRYLLILSEQELNQLVEQRHLALGDAPPPPAKKKNNNNNKKKQTNKLVCISLLRLVMHTCQLSRFFRESPSFSSNLLVSRLEHQVSRELATMALFTFLFY